MQTFLKLLPLASGFLLTLFLPFAIKKSTRENAKEEGVTNDPYSLEWLLAWRDLIIAIYTGIFVLQFSAASAIGSKSLIAKNVKLSDVAFVTIILVSFILLFGWILLSKLKVHNVQTKRGIKYWFVFFPSVLIWYILSFFFVYYS
ncbi:MAG TPA: hypothetical protein VEP90_25440 [Methylomirabilota bacterium]|nr:hypothetical protein [Methylomirabilota bacterium]